MGEFIPMRAQFNGFNKESIGLDTCVTKVSLAQVLGYEEEKTKYGT